MFGNTRDKRRGAFVDHFDAMAVWLAACLSLLTIPMLFHEFEGYTYELALKLYGQQLGWFAFWIGWALLCPVIYFALRASMLSSIVVAAIWAAQRFI